MNSNELDALSSIAAAPTPTSAPDAPRPERAGSAATLATPPATPPAEPPAVYLPGRPRESWVSIPTARRVRDTSTGPAGRWPEFMQPILKDDGDPHVLMLGASRLGRAITRTLRRSNVDARSLGRTAEAIEAISPWTKAVVVAPPLEVLEPETAIPVLEVPAGQASADLVLVVDENDDELAARASELAEETRAMLYRWPRDAMLLTQQLRP